MATVDFWCDLSQQGTELLHSWEHTVGSCHAPIALRADWQQQLRRCRAELEFRYVRFHGLLSDDLGTVVRHNDELLSSFVTRAQAVERTLATLRFFWKAPQGPMPDATGHRGFVYHFLDVTTSRRVAL